jgi:hypothetical protein
MAWIPGAGDAVKGFGKTILRVADDVPTGTITPPGGGGGWTPDGPVTPFQPITDPSRLLPAPQQPLLLPATTPEQLEFGIVPFVERQTVARDFYRAAGWPDARIVSHVKGIDFDYPVQPITIPRDTVLSQYGFPGDPTGNYFAYPGTPALGLGIYPHGRVQSLYQATADLSGLKSTAAAVTDTWSVPSWAIDVPGGQTQLFVPNKGGMQRLP